jgi:hypothetical protein
MCSKFLGKFFRLFRGGGLFQKIFFGKFLAKMLDLFGYVRDIYYLCNMKHILFLLLLISLGASSQRVQYNDQQPYISNLTVHFNVEDNPKILTCRLSHKFKLTASTYVNQCTKEGRYLEKILDPKSHSFEFGDYIDILTYDLRAKYYITPINGLICRLYTNGLYPKSRILTMGWTYHF